MVEARKSIPGRDADLPAFIVERMEALQLQPTLTQLALGIGASKSGLRENLKGLTATKLETAIKLAEFLRCELKDLVQYANLR